jgi:hypothetical protein
MPRGLSDYESAVIQGRLWSPEVLSLLSWQDFSDLSTLSVDSSGINEIRDKSGSGRNFAQTNNSYKPAPREGRSGVYEGNFGTSGKMINSSASWPTGAKSFAAAWKADAAPPSGGSLYFASFKNTTSNAYSEFGVTSVGGYQPRFFIADFTSVNNVRGLSDAISTSPEIFLWTYDGGSITANASYTARLQGAEKAVIASGATNRINYTTEIASISGRSDSSGAPIQSVEWNGQIYEALVASGVLSFRERQLIEGYLSWKWAIPLAADHPYANRPPLIGD